MIHSQSFPGSFPFLRRSRRLAGSASLASMLPSCAQTGLLTLLASMAYDLGRNAGHGWLATWLVSWALAFPALYLARLTLKAWRVRARRTPALSVHQFFAVTRETDRRIGLHVQHRHAPRLR